MDGINLKLAITTRKRVIGPDQKYHLLFHPVLIWASVPGATASWYFWSGPIARGIQESLWHQVMAQPGTND